MHDFLGSPDDGYEPWGSLTLSGTTLYGMTYSGGSSNKGVVFRMDTNGLGYTKLHDFADGDNDGDNPNAGQLTVSGDALTFYGMTMLGGASNVGVVFRMNGFEPPPTVTPADGPYAGGNLVLVTNAVPALGNGSDITNIVLGGVGTTNITGQGANWVTFVAPAVGSAGAKDLAIQSASAGAPRRRRLRCAQGPGPARHVPASGHGPARHPAGQCLD